MQATVKQVGSGNGSVGPVFYDTHAHLDYPDFTGDLPAVLERARSAGIGRIISIGTDMDSSRRAVALATAEPMVQAAVGWHPNHVSAAPADVRPALRELAAHPRVVAIGEIGMDYYRLSGDKVKDDQDKKRQAEVFVQQLEVAAEMNLNCVIHQRSALEDTLTLMEPFRGKIRAVFHCFVDDSATADRILALGHCLSFTGIITFKNGVNVRNTLMHLPLGQFMLETDSPFLAPMPYRGKRCEPAHIREIAQLVALVKGCSLEQLSEHTCHLADEFFRKKQ
jgi:TatD DNase family protein